MNYRYQKVNPQIAEYVRTILVFAKDNERSDLPLFTNETPALLCRTVKMQTGIENVLQLTLYGKSVPPDVWNVKKNETLIAYFFKPFSLPCLFNFPATQLAQNPVELSAWDAHKINALKTQLAYAKTASEKIEALNGLLVHQLQLQQRECEILRYATDQILLNSDKEILGKILSKLKLNERTFQRIFKKFVGITPNQYRRICQFKLSFEQLKSGKFEKLTDVAYNTGFADQSHFIRSFKEFTQITPKEYTMKGLKQKKS